MFYSGPFIYYFYFWLFFVKCGIRLLAKCMIGSVFGLIYACHKSYMHERHLSPLPPRSPWPTVSFFYFIFFNSLDDRLTSHITFWTLRDVFVFFPKLKVLCTSQLVIQKTCTRRLYKSVNVLLLNPVSFLTIFLLCWKTWFIVKHQCLYYLLFPHI